MKKGKVFKITNEQLMKLHGYLKEYAEPTTPRNYDQENFIVKRENEKAVELSGIKINVFNPYDERTTETETRVRIRRNTNFISFFNIELATQYGTDIEINYDGNRHILNILKRGYGLHLLNDELEKLYQIVNECFSYIQENPEKMYDPKVRESLTTETEVKNISI